MAEKDRREKTLKAKVNEEGGFYKIERGFAL